MKNIVAKILANYWSNEKGLVTIEWVGIAAVIVVAGILITSFVMTSADNLSGDINGALAGAGDQVGTASIPTFGGGGTGGL